MSFQEVQNKVFELLEIEQLGSMSIEEKMSIFLDLTSKISISKSEKIRQLAIALEKEFLINKWEELIKLYEFSLLEDPTNVDTYHSIAVSAIEWIDSHQGLKFDAIEMILRCAEENIKKAIEVAGPLSRLYYTFGQIIYSRQSKTREDHINLTQKAKDLFQRAYDLDQSNQMANLYIAYCLEDLQEWEAAFKKYCEVKSDVLGNKHPDWKWRTYALEKNKALCCIKLGKVDKAIEIIEQYLSMLRTLSYEDILKCIEEDTNIFDFLNTHLRKEFLLNELKNIYLSVGIEIP